MQSRFAPAFSHGDRRRWIALVVVCLAMLMNVLDSSIVNVALPSIQRELHFTQSNLTWVVNAYLIGFGSFLLLAGRLGDLIGRKRVFLSGVALFTLASAACAVSSSQAMLIAARFIQGVGGAVCSSVIVAIIVTEFSTGAERSKAMSAYMFVAVSGGSIGLLVGGLLTQAVNWHWIFVINLPIGLVTFVLGMILVDENVGLGVRQGVDWAGSLLMTSALMVGIFGIVGASADGWLSAHTLGCSAAALALLAGFFVLEARLTNPIMPLRILRIRSLTGSSVVRACTFIGMYSIFFFGALYLERVRGFLPLRTGLAFLPMSVIVAVLSLGITSRLFGRFGAMKLLVPGLAFVMIGLLLMAGVTPTTDYWTGILPAFVLLGAGMGIASVPLLSIAMADVPIPDAGLASGIVNVSMWLSSSIGLAVLGTLSANHTAALARHGASLPAALVGGYRLAFLVSALCAAVGLVIVLTVLRTSAREVSVTVRDERAADTTPADTSPAGGDPGELALHSH